MGVTKFRAWDNQFKHWVGSAEYVIDPYTGKFLAVAGYEILKHEYDVIVEQYTGIDDVNEKEIYTGDIVKLYGEVFDTFGFEVIKQMVGQVVFRHGCFWITSLVGDEPMFAYEEDFEVIGNIHENIELLEK